ncbi:MAG: acetolactate synthase large subunit [Gammaproteobacteria bacterium]
MKASDLFLRCLETLGVDTIFGVPGEENADLMISLLDSPIEFIVCRHEQSAAFMADMYGRLSGKPGVCLATLGPGATNLVTGVVNANLDKVPVIGIIGQAETTRLHKESHQNMKAIPMFMPVTKWATSIQDVSVIPEVLQKAYKLAIGDKPGAIVIELPEDIAKEKTKLAPLTNHVKNYERGVEDDAIERALEMLKESKKPLVLVGSGCTYYECDQSLRKFIDKTQCYFTATFMGKGALSARDSRSLYCVGLGMKDIAVEAFDQADLVITIGYDMIEWHPDKWNASQDKKIIHIDTTPAEVDAHYLPDLELVGDLTVIIEQLTEDLLQEHKKEEGYFSKIRDRITAELEEHCENESFPMKPQRLISDTRKALKDDDILISDVGAHKMWVARQYPTYYSKTCFIYNGFASMGGAMPGAFVAKRLHPEKNVVALCGDGGFIMSIQALPTAVRYKVPFVVVVWEDDHYGLIKWKQEMTYKKHSHVDLENNDLVQLSQAFGCHATRIAKAQDFLPALENAFKEKTVPTVIVVPVDYSENMKLTKRLGSIVAH